MDGAAFPLTDPTLPLFLYGTLRDAALFKAVAGPGTARRTAARLADHRVISAPGGQMPGLVPAPGEVARGVLVEGLSEAQQARLDAYELDYGYDLRPVRVETAGGPRDARAYILRDAGGEGRAPWDYEGWAEKFGPATALAADEFFAHEPPLSAAELDRQWPMMMMRAFARLRAGAGVPPADVRHRPAPGDLTLRRRAPMSGDFFKHDRMLVDHRRFDGGREKDLPREVLVGADAALVLPYDPARGRVLLVEQLRMGAARRGDANPWSLEPVAGIVDAGETPEEAAHREAFEEAGVRFRSLHHMFAIYASPGSTTDHFYCFLGVTDLPDGHQATGGLESEAEDLRLHVLPFDAALDLIDTGEANAGPLVAMLLWLARARDRLEFAGGGP